MLSAYTTVVSIVQDHEVNGSKVKYQLHTRTLTKDHPGIQVVTGHRFLGGFLGSRSERDEYVMSKVHKWVGHVDVLAGAVVTQPQLAYATLSRSLQHKWKFLLLVVPQCGQLF